MLNNDPETLARDMARAALTGYCPAQADQPLHCVSYCGTAGRLIFATEPAVAGPPGLWIYCLLDVAGSMWRPARWAVLTADLPHSMLRRYIYPADQPLCRAGCSIHYP